MFKSTILPSDDPNLVVPETLRKGVERANQFLDTMLPVDTRDIDCTWKFEKDEVGVFVRLTLKTRHNDAVVGGPEGHPMEAEVFENDSSLRRGLRTVVETFLREIQPLSRFDLSRQKKRLERMTFAEVE